MTIKEIIDGLRFTVDMFLFDDITGEMHTEPRNELDKATIDACKGAIKLLEQTRWIPVSEKLPDYNKQCLVTFECGLVDIMCYALDLYKVDEYDFCAKKGKAGWYEYDSEWGYYSRDDIVAWMPLPKPYKVESEDKK